MDAISLMPMIEKKLNDGFCFSTLMKNPRINELSHILLKLSERYGSILEDPNDWFYASKISERAYHLLYMANIIQVEEGNILVQLPEYIDGENKYSKKETLRYEIGMNGNIKRTQVISEKSEDMNKTKTSVSIINADGIEIQRITDTRGTNLLDPKVYVYERVSNNPCIVRRTIDGKNEETFYDNTESKKIEDIVAKKENKIEKEKVKPLDSEQYKQIMENNKYSLYMQGIKRILGKVRIIPADTGR